MPLAGALARSLLLGDLQHRLPPNVPAEQGIRSVRCLVPRPAPTDLRVDPSSGQQSGEVGEVRGHVATHDEHLQAPATSPAPLLLEVDGGRLQGRLADADREAAGVQQGEGPRQLGTPTLSSTPKTGSVTCSSPVTISAAPSSRSPSPRAALPTTASTWAPARAAS